MSTVVYSVFCTDEELETINQSISDEIRPPLESQLSSLSLASISSISPVATDHPSRNFEENSQGSMGTPAPWQRLENIYTHTCFYLAQVYGYLTESDRVRVDDAACK